jgi:UDP-glucose 4-epimerase
MKVLVVGGSGFLGSYVCDELSKRNHEIIILDKSKSIFLKQKQKQIVIDVNDIKKDATLLKGIDYVYFFSGISDLNECKTKPLETVTQNILPLVNFLKLCVRNKIKRFVYASSVYVNSREGSFYKSSKLACESYIKEFYKAYGLNYTILRYGSVYGPRSDKRNGLFRILHNAIHKKKLIYDGSADSVREYIHVSDAAKTSVDILSSEYKNQTLVLTGQEPMRISDLLKTIAEILNKNYKIIFKKKKNISGHYNLSPYSYDEDVNLKLRRNSYIDMGQGLIQLVNFIKDKNK